MQLDCSELSPSTTRFTSVTPSNDQLSISARGRSPDVCYPCLHLVTSLAGFSCLMFSALDAKHTATLGVSLTRVVWLTWQVLSPPVSVLWVHQRNTVRSSPHSHSASAAIQRGGTRPGHPMVREGGASLRETTWRICPRMSSRSWYDTSRTHASVRFAWITRLPPLSVRVVMLFVAWSVQPCARNAHCVGVRSPTPNESSFRVNETWNILWTWTFRWFGTNTTWLN